jgi:hypothetical protein
MLPLLAGTVKRAIVPATTPTPKPARRDGYLMKARTAQVESIVTGSMGVPPGTGHPRCEWHGNGTKGEDRRHTVARARRLGR